jgi:glycerol-3-phosphate acyltransferase PlsY
MTSLVILIPAAILSYLIGAIPFSLLIARAHGVDVRKVGSGNVGATNVLRSVGKAAGITALLLDVAKGFGPTYLIPLAFANCADVGDAPLLPIICALSAICGHVWPVYLKFRGGKGIATSAGSLIALAPTAVLIGLIAWIIVLFGSRYVSLASIAAAAVIPGVAWYLYSPEGMLLPCTLTVMGIMAILKHRSNISRLLSGSESKISLGKKTKPGTEDVPCE